jgi:hypothetical protein
MATRSSTLNGSECSVSRRGRFTPIINVKRMGPTTSVEALNKKPSLLLKGIEQRSLGRPRRSLVTIPNPQVTKLGTFSVMVRRHKIRRFLHQLFETTAVRRK